jgi:hypothetical protein
MTTSDLDSCLEIEELGLRSGLAEGDGHGFALGHTEGYRTGVEHGAALGRELGAYHGSAHAVAERAPQGTRAAKAAAEVIAAVEAFSPKNLQREGFDEELQAIRAKYKLLAALVGTEEDDQSTGGQDNEPPKRLQDLEF